MRQANSRRDIPGAAYACYVVTASGPTDTQFLPSINPPLTVEWHVPIYDPAGAWSASQPTRLTVRSAGWYNFYTVQPIQAIGTKSDRQGFLKKNGTTLCYCTMVEGSGSGRGVVLNLETGPVQCVAGDYFQFVIINWDINSLLIGGSSWNGSAGFDRL